MEEKGTYNHVDQDEVCLLRAETEDESASEYALPTNIAGKRQKGRRAIFTVCAVLALVGVAFSVFRSSSPLDATADQTEGIVDLAADVKYVPDMPADPEGATNGEATPFKNIFWATLGYNLYYGDPLPILPKGAAITKDMKIMDPGLRKPLFAIEYTKGRLTGDRRHTSPDGYHTTVDMGCSTVFTTKTIRDEYEYMTEQSKSVSASARAEAAVKFPPTPPTKKFGKTGSIGVSGKAFARVGGTMSYQWKDMQKQNTMRDQRMYRSQAKCNAYTVAFSYAFPPKTHPDFQKVVDGLSGDGEAYYDMFDNYGTHMLTTIKMGARFGVSSLVEKSKLEELQKNADGLGLSVEASMGVCAKVGVKVAGKSMGVKVAKKVEAKLPLLTPEEKTTANKLETKFGVKKSTSMVGPPLPTEGVAMWSEMVNDNPVPYSWDSDPICQHPAISEKKTTYDNCVKFMESYCQGRLVKRGAHCVAAAEKECYNDLDCKEDFVCRNWKCVAVPKCNVEIFQNDKYGGSSYALPTVTAVKMIGGRLYDLHNGNWADKISSIKLSSGCQRVEAIDDDSNCVLGKSDNGRYSVSVSSLPNDLDNDVCKIKVWAKEVPKQIPGPGVSGWIDLSEGVSASVSSGGNANRAIDGNSDNSYGGGSCTHTDSSNQPWWKVNLGQKYNIDTVKITNRGDCCGDRLKNFDVVVDGISCYSSPGQIAQGATAELPCKATGSIVMIKMKGSGILTLCEVGVKGMVPPGAPVPATPGTWLDMKGKSTSQSSTSNGAVSSRAVDGDKNPQWGGGSCTHTAPNKPNAWWQVKLGGTYQVEKVSVTNRGDCCGDRLSNFNIYVNDKQCSTDASVKQGQTGEITCGGTGDTVKIQRKGNGVLTICEVGIKAIAKRRLQESEDFNNASAILALPPLVTRELPPTAPEKPLSENNLRGEASAPQVESAVPQAMHEEISDEPWEAKARRLAASEYLANIGKAGYGYNPFFGAPTSYENAGTDPGWVHRPIFKVQYTKGITATIKKFDSIPRDKDTGTPGGERFKTVNGMYLSGYVPGVDGKSFGIQDGKDRCFKEKLCMGLTCKSEKCTLRKGDVLKPSPGGEMSIVKVDKVSTAGASQPCAATTYDSKDMTGKPWTFTAGDYPFTPFTRIAQNDRISSMKVTGGPGCEVTIYQHGSFGGWKAKFGPGDYNEAALIAKGAKTNDVSSIQVAEKGRRLLEEVEMTNSSEKVVYAPEVRRLGGAPKVPDGWKVTKAQQTVCDMDFSTKEVKSLYDYEATQKESLNPLGIKIDLGPVSFSMSGESKEFQSSNQKMKKIQYITTAECFEYMAEIDKSTPPETSDNFKYILDSMPDNDEQWFFHLFDLFGTYYPTTVYFGAKYGFAQNIDESSYKTVAETSSSFSVGAEATYGIKKKKGIPGGDSLSFSATAGVGSKSSSKEGEKKDFSSYFSETKEFSLGRRMPNEGGAAAWVQQVEGEAMPYRYGLTPICDHPGLPSSKKSVCTSAIKNYCSKWLVKSNEDIDCEPAEKKECVWDLDCMQHYTCTSKGTCQKNPDCIVKMYTGNNLGGTMYEYGPVYAAETPEGKVFDYGKKINSVWTSPGCAEVILMDEDKCREQYEDNEVIENRNSDESKQINDIKYDLENDICKIKLTAKTKWASKSL